jgi:hypothetical protein
MKQYKFWVSRMHQGQMTRIKFGCLTASSVDEATIYLRQNYPASVYGVQPV